MSTRLREHFWVATGMLGTLPAIWPVAREPALWQGALQVLGCGIGYARAGYKDRI